METKKLNYITIEYECEEELLNDIIKKFDTERYKDCYVNVNCLYSENQNAFINFDFYFLKCCLF